MSKFFVSPIDILFIYGIIKRLQCFFLQVGVNMLIDVSKIKGCAGDIMDIDTCLDISELDPAFSNVRFVGKIKNTAGVLTMKATVSGKYNTYCDRCAEKTVLDLEANLDTIFDLNSSKDDSLTLDNGKIDLLKTSFDALFLEIPMTILCKDDCCGLCPHCGTNLNVGSCGCNDSDF